MLSGELDEKFLTVIYLIAAPALDKQVVSAAGVVPLTLDDDTRHDAFARNRIFPR